MPGALLCLSIIACKGSAEISVGATSSASGTQQWFADAYAKASNATAAYQYGSSVAIDGNRAVIGSPQEGTSGAVYVLRNDGTNWVEEALLKAGNADSNDNFGFSVAISGDTLVVGATTEQGNVPGITNGAGGDTLNGGTQIGAVYIYRRSGTAWSQEAYIKAANANIGAGIFFGYAVAISGDTIAVGAPGEQSNVTTITNGPTASSNNSAPISGAVFIYKRTGVNWAQEAYIKAPNAEGGDRFGQAVSIDGDTVAVGANNEDNSLAIIAPSWPFTNNNAATNAGAAYIFKRAGVNWTLEAYLKASNADAGDQFGYSLSISGDTVAVGAIGESSGFVTIVNGGGSSADNSQSSAGAAYVFKRTGTTWNWESYLKAPNARNERSFRLQRCHLWRYCGRRAPIRKTAISRV